VLGDAADLLANITRLKSDLANVIEPDFGLLDELLSLKVLTRRQNAKIRSGDKTVYEQNDALLDLLVSEDQCDKFVTALQRTDQAHVVNCITPNGGQTHCSFKLSVRLIVIQVVNRRFFNFDFLIHFCTHLCYIMSLHHDQGCVRSRFFGLHSRLSI